MSLVIKYCFKNGFCLLINLAHTIINVGCYVNFLISHTTVT